MSISHIYKVSQTLLTDLYQLTMAQGYWKHGTANRDAIFHLFFRKHPFQGGYTVAAGLDYALDVVENFRFDATDIGYLRQLRGNNDSPLFDSGFLDVLESMELSVDIDAVPEGTFVFPHAPMLRVTGPIMQCQLLETIFLNVINFQTLIATKAARICHAANGDSVLEFGLRRAQGMDGALAASRAAYLGGCHATSNVLAGKLFGIPVKGTHAHSWVMSFDSEQESFAAYAEAMPNNCVFLVDTYDTLEGVRHAVTVGQQLRSRGHEMVGIRLDSGDLAYLSIEARKILDEAGFPEAAIVASNDLNEKLIASLKQQGATISVWGVGTKLATAFDQPALGGVYKLGAMKNETGRWEPKIKLSEQLIKTSTPGKLQIRRFYEQGQAIADMVFNELNESNTQEMVDPLDPTRRSMMNFNESECLLLPVVRGGRVVYDRPNLECIRQRALEQRNLFHPSHLRFDNPHEYRVGLESELLRLKTELATQLRQRSRGDA